MATLKEFMKTRTGPRRFQPKPFYSPDGDFLLYYVADKDHFAERVDDVLTVFKAMDDESLIGFKIKGITCLIKSASDLRLEFNVDGKPTLQALLIAAAIDDPKRNTLAYRYFIKKTSGVSLPTETVSCPA